MTKVFIVLQTDYKTVEYGGPKDIIKSVHMNNTSAHEKCAKLILDSTMCLEEFVNKDDPKFMFKIKEFMLTAPTGREMDEFVISHRQLFEKYELLSYEVQSYDLSDIIISHTVTDKIDPMDCGETPQSAGSLNNNGDEILE